ncbi:hypothetical protein K493DRAFT_296279 [Basidiobolus meristosporus CBS 931.73]|uniref:SH3 domain-containing protein n=1 Tax=Basidiobolus meristosporus CBS 931.73 TaxID=1314790 RepID=A0A1Y1Z6J7_9FUNG|nr:hypothetical protein K493DRAFT_296279 [Basidiobolus meristosporus CBS 931.73]|eukprot:ORY05879.1 hypothetical protein K493DRAFT_296279 [Basidiobolus meristosporus CBS 931.73]
MFFTYLCCFRGENDSTASQPQSASSHKIRSILIANQQYPPASNEGESGLNPHELEYSLLHFEKGDRICVVSKSETHLIGYLEKDPRKVLGCFPTGYGDVEKSWLSKKWSTTSQDSTLTFSSTEDDDDAHLIEPRYLTEIVTEPTPLDMSQFSEIDLADTQEMVKVAPGI